MLNGEAAKRAAARGDFHELDLPGSQSLWLKKAFGWQARGSAIFAGLLVPTLLSSFSRSNKICVLAAFASGIGQSALKSSFIPWTFVASETIFVLWPEQSRNLKYLQPKPLS